MMRNLYLQTALIGVASGMRSMAGPALASDHLTRHPSEALAGSSLGWLGTDRAALITKFLAAGEIIGDKLPMTPSRIAPVPLLGRIASGGLSGAALCAAAGKPAAVGAAIGALGAVAGAFTFYYLRRSAGQRTAIPDPVLGAVEDGLVYGGGLLVLK